MQVKEITVEQFRPTALLPWTYKFYMTVLLDLMKPYTEPTGFYQYGNRRYHQCSELVHILRLLLEKGCEWGIPIVIDSIDIYKAFDTLCPTAVEELFVTCGVPDALSFAILQEILDPKYFFPLFYGQKGKGVPKHSVAGDT